MAATGDRFVRAVYHLRKDQKRRVAQKALDDGTPGGASGVLRDLIDRHLGPTPTNPAPGRAEEGEGS